MDIKSLYRNAVDEISSACTHEESVAVARVLVSEFLGVPFHYTVTEPGWEPEPASEDRFRSAVHEVAAGRPLQYVTGTVDFCSIRIKVDERVLIPRPETEYMMRLVREMFRKGNPKVLDVCTGSGCIAWSIASMYPDADVYACDLSSGALELASSQNAASSSPVFFNADVLSPGFAGTVRSAVGDELDLIVSNPPYVRKSEASSMKANVLDHEPHMALFVDDSDPLVFYRVLSSLSEEFLVSGGMCMMEINEAFGESTSSLFSPDSFDVMVMEDLNGKDRYVAAVRR